MAEFIMDVRMHYFQTIKEQRVNPDFLVRNEDGCRIKAAIRNGALHRIPNA
jgi:hypothetical protein